jgi:DNA-directed RNA polymerase beta subunit
MDFIIQGSERRMAIQLTRNSNFRFRREAHTIHDSVAFKKNSAWIKFKLADSML